jgi:predicted CXXCH cytochrome family protein
LARKSKKNRHTHARPNATPAARPVEGKGASSGRAGAGLRTLALAIAAAAAVGVAALAAYRWDAPGSRFLAAKSAETSVTPAPLTAHYVGGGSCIACHAEEQAAWHDSHHDLAMQIADEKSVRGAFDNAKFAYAGTTSTFSRRGGKFYVSTDGPDGTLADYEIKYAFGVRPLQQYLIEFPGGRLQALSIAWDTRAKEDGGQRWFHLYPGQDIRAGDPLHWTGLNQNWNFQCAECHSTNLRKNFDARTETFATSWSQINVSCEACHGPGSNHVAWAQKTGDWRSMAASKGLEVLLDERKGVAWTPVIATGNARRSHVRTTAREVETCARCHARSSRISDDYVHGKPPLDTHRLALLDANLYWSDGQMRDEVYNWGAFLQSKMYAHGVTCSDCHDPHSLKLRVPGNALCAQCHQAAVYDDRKHTQHEKGTSGAACTACHMPTTTYMVVDPRHDHSMRIPRPDVSARVGSPNACNNCHTKQTAQWAADTILNWTGKPPASYQRFADALHAGSAAAPGARSALVALIEDKAQPVIVRASAIQRLGALLTPGTIDFVTRSLNDTDGVVRLAAVEALASTDLALRQRYLPRMLDDPVRAVRVEAARALAGSGEDWMSEALRATFARVLAEYIATQTYNADRPEGRIALGNLAAQRNDAPAALAQYRKAIEMDPTFVPAYANMADLHRARRADVEAIATLREGLVRNPRAAVLHHSLGLALVRRKEAAEGLGALRMATQLAPESARFAYVYAVALHDSGQSKLAMQVLAAALKRAPYDRELLSALAYYTAQAGNRKRALVYAKLLQELDPENSEYAELEKQIASTPLPHARP